ncbi:FtsX-like permease family protein [Gordonia shandongensis]|uniref:FtsX-like permease family protein n=1 Tax=Gordonia shandongensis TaxID=376351 RepID=UPI0003F97E6E|nr:FtsX-like permease family protein [Gordonia shandongensis]
MYLGLREIRSAKGRFAGIGAVVALVAFMVVGLSALTEGLGQQSISAVQDLPGAGVVVQEDDGSPALLSDSSVPAATVADVTARDSGARELGIATLRAGAGERSTTVSAFGRSDVHEVALEREVAETLGIGAGDSLQIGDRSVEIDAVSDVGHYAHQPVVELPLATWQEVSGRDQVNAVIVDAAVDAPAGSVMVETSAVLDLVPGYRSEHMSLLLIQGLLMVISAVVVGAFFAVWTGQRVPSLAVVRAMGAGRWYLLRDGLSQAALILVAGLAVGGGIGLGGVSLIGDAVPIAIEPVMTGTVLGAMAVLGLGGAALALLPLLRVDPLRALNR